MDANETEIVRTVKQEKRSLLERYDIPVEHLSYEYISECKDVKKLERIVIILRSGEEGFYPDLTKYAEERLALVKPTSIILRKSEPIITRNMLEPSKCKEIDKDINNWTSEMRSREKDLEEGRATFENAVPQPEVRQYKEEITKKPLASSSKNPIKNKRISSCDYDAWDKYDVDTELNKIDIRDEQQRSDAKRFQQKQRKISEAKKLEKHNIIERSSLTGTELNVMAEEEKGKGNEAFRAGDYKEALEHYNISIKLDSNVAAYNNRAMTYIKLERYEEALNDCSFVLSTDYKNVKALLRRAVSLEHLDKPSQALADYEAILKLEPHNAIAIAGVKKLRKPCESRKVRMTIEEEIDDTNRTTNASNIDRSIIEQSARVSLENSICFCDRAPGSSQNLRPRPHIKADYCLEDEKKQIATFRNNVSKKSEKDGRKNVSAEAKTRASSDGNNTGKNNIPQNAKQKSIFSTKMPAKRASSVIIEELPQECNDNIKKTIEGKSGKSDKKIINASNVKELSKNLQESCNLNEKRSPKKIEVADKYKNKTSKEEKHVPKSFSNIESGYEFMCAWKSLKNDTDLKVHARLLRSLNIDKLNSVLGNELDGDMFSKILRCLEKHFCSLNDTVVLNQFLRSLSQVKRFTIINMFASIEDKRAINNILNFLEEHGTSEVSTLRQIYCV